MTLTFNSAGNYFKTLHSNFKNNTKNFKAGERTLDGSKVAEFRDDVNFMLQGN